LTTLNHTSTEPGTATRDAALLEVRDLRVSFGSGHHAVEVVHGVDLAVHPGRVAGLVGESGSGKSVTARAVMNLLRPPGRVTGGTIRFEGTDLLSLDETQWRDLRGRRIAMIFQDPLSSLNPSMRIGSQITEALRAHGHSGSQARVRALELLDLVRIPDAARRFRAYPHEFSGGMRQRVVIAIALANAPTLLIADEPTTALDVTVQTGILSLLRELRDDLNLATLFITHDFGVVAEFCDDVTVMRDGLVVERAAAAELFENPAEPYTRLLLDAVPRVDLPRPDRPLREATGDRQGSSVLQVDDLRVDVTATRSSMKRTDPVFAVDGVSLTIAAGEVLGLVGESGCGKSTLSRAICGILPATEGTIRFDGTDVTGLPVGHAARRGVQYVFQDALAALNPLRTVRQTLLEAAAAAPDPASAPSPEELMELVGLGPDTLDRRPAAFSGGQRQRIGIARSLAARPRLLLCDEPVSALDVSVQAQVIALLEKLRDELGIAMLFIAHDLAVVRHISDRVAVMYKGRIVETGSVEAVYDHPTHEYTASLLEASPIPAVGVTRQRIIDQRTLRWSH
jgi:ABC-type glutathione transport system ATPase component